MLFSNFRDILDCVDYKMMPIKTRAADTYLVYHFRDMYMVISRMDCDVATTPND